MNITTKFKLGDQAFRLHHNKVQAVKVIHFQVNVKPNPVKEEETVIEICYTLAQDEQNFSARDHDNYEYEGSLYATKAELLASL